MILQMHDKISVERMEQMNKWNIKQLLYPFILIVGHQSRVLLFYYESTLGNY